MILIDIKYTQELSKVDAVRKEHICHLSQYYDRALIQASGPYNNREGGFIISTMSLNEANIYVKNDPYFIANVASFNIKVFEPTKTSDEFKYLIETKKWSSDGKQLFEQLHGNHAGEDLITALSGISPVFANMAFDFAFEKVFARQSGMPMMTKELIVIATLCAMGDTQPQIRSHVEAVMNTGATKEMIVEVLLLLTPIIGFARVANTLMNLAEM
jgi:4-carboxymuconolactone decarboxylase